MHGHDLNGRYNTCAPAFPPFISQLYRAMNDASGLVSVIPLYIKKHPMNKQKGMGTSTRNPNATWDCHPGCPSSNNDVGGTPAYATAGASSSSDGGT